jgi:hypothetical protein
MPTSTVFSLITLDLSCPLWAYNLDEATTSGNTNQPNRLTYHRTPCPFRRGRRLMGAGATADPNEGRSGVTRTPLPP